jgi:redox-sensing transcriptional repressor
MGVKDFIPIHLQMKQVILRSGKEDFSEFKNKREQKGGYNIDELLEKMESIFHRNKDHNIVLIGMGNLGLALSKYSRFVQRNMNVVATFDIDPFKQKQRSEMPVYSMSRLKEIIDRFRVKVQSLQYRRFQHRVADERSTCHKGNSEFAPVLLKSTGVWLINVNLVMNWKV